MFRVNFSFGQTLAAKLDPVPEGARYLPLAFSDSVRSLSALDRYG